MPLPIVPYGIGYAEWSKRTHRPTNLIWIRKNSRMRKIKRLFSYGINIKIGWGGVYSSDLISPSSTTNIRRLFDITKDKCKNPCVFYTLYNKTYH
jgi:hypothetical protein